MTEYEAAHLSKGDTIRFADGSEGTVEEVVAECVVRFNNGDYRSHINCEDMRDVTKVEMNGSE